MRIRIPHTLFIAFILLLNSCNGEDVQIDNALDFEEAIADEMNSQKIPALSTLIFKEDNILYEKYFGQSNVEQNVALSSNHVFLLASISKTITATALLQLYDNGLFDLNDKINDHLPFAVKVPGQSTDITFKMLLTHTSGIADGDALDGQYYYGEDSPVALDFFLENYLTPGGQFYNAGQNYHSFEPGTQHEYSNVGNALIAVLVEQISGMGFNAYCKQNIFTPLGMTNSFWRLDEISQPIVQPYEYTGGQYKAIQHYTFTDYPNGGLRSNVSDMFIFLSTLAQGGSNGSFELLKASTVAAMFSPQIPNLDNTVGLHMFLFDPNNNLWGHDGGEEGVATIMAFNPETKIGVLIFANQGDADLDDMLVDAYQLGSKL